MANVVENPIICSAFEEPTRHHRIRPREDTIVVKGRRPAQYLIAHGERKGGPAQVTHEYRELEQVNLIRAEVKKWREENYKGATRATHQLLRHWTNPDRERKLFYCQIEAAETVIWLTEIWPKTQVKLQIESPDPFLRWCCKMATGAGKTVVMAMLIAWQVINKAADRQDARFSDAVLIVCPNLTIKDRLQVLQLQKKDGPGGQSYYEKFDIVPSDLRPLLDTGRVMVTNWHLFLPEEDVPESLRRRHKGGGGVDTSESDSAFCSRVLAELGGKRNLLVLNDEAHHAYSVYPKPDKKTGQLELVGETFESDLSGKDEALRARVWIEGLDRIHKARGIRHCMDLSATPYFLKGSNRLEGTPFEWIVSDFGLLDAIECGIVKVPYIPDWDNSGRKEPKYMRLYQEVKSKLPQSERALRTAGAGIKVVEEVQGALATLYDGWMGDKAGYEKAGETVPPCMIVVCHNTATAELLEGFIASGEANLPELKNRDVPPARTVRIDSRLLEDVSARSQTQTQEEFKKERREMLFTVGKPGGKGEQIRCIVSVAMLNEGWDAQNVTQILGLRAFSSPLLCEQVIGRGLRRKNYDDLSAVEKVTVYGIPFNMLPIAAGGGPGEPVDYKVVRSLPAREREHEILFPCVAGYINDVRNRIVVNWDGIPGLVVTPEVDPTKVLGKTPFGTYDDQYDTKHEFYEANRLQAAFFDIAERLIEGLGNRLLFPQVLAAVEHFHRDKVKHEKGVDPREFCHGYYKNRCFEQLSAHIRSADPEDKGRFRPILDPNRPIGTTKQTFFQTTLFCVDVQKSHLDRCACHSPVWEKSICVQLEQHQSVLSHVRNYKLDFTIPYDFQGETLPYVPDFIVRLRPDNGEVFHLVLEVKGIETNQDRAKVAGALKWVEAVNIWGKLGRWHYESLSDLNALDELIERIAAETS